MRLPIRSTLALATALVCLIAVAPASASPRAGVSLGSDTTVSYRSDQARAAYRLFGYRWRGRRIPYYNAAKGDAWAVEQAVSAWNRSGVRVRLVPVPRRRARLVVRYYPRTSGCVAKGRAPTLVQGRRILRAQVWISRPDARQIVCSRWSLALVATHEIGHVLGLDHENRGCSVMNSTSSGLAPVRCPGATEVRWRCRLLEPDDVRAAVRLYGGRVRPRPAPLCDLAAPPSTPQGLVAGAPFASLGPSGTSVGVVPLRFFRPPDPAYPAHVSSPNAAFATAAGSPGCPSAPPAGAFHAYTAAAGGLQDTFAYLVPGRNCIAVWTTDISGRVSAPALTTVDYIPPPGASVASAP